MVARPGGAATPRGGIEVDGEHEIVIHAGLGKVGSTSLQRILRLHSLDESPGGMVALIGTGGVGGEDQDSLRPVRTEDFSANLAEWARRT